MIYIYALIDPDTKQVRYIGKSIRPKQRLDNQMNEVSNCHRSNWLQQLKTQKKRPYQIILQELGDSDNWQEWEIAWIRHGKNVGWPLTNNTDGGDGVCNLPYETRQKMAQTWLGKKHKPETIEKLKIARAKRVTSDETRKKHSISMTGRKIEWKDKISEANKKFSKEDVASIKSRLFNGEKGINLAREFNVHRTTITKIKMGKYPSFNPMPEIDVVAK